MIKKKLQIPVSAELTCQHNFPRDKNEKNNPRLDHAVNESRKQLWFVAETSHNNVLL